MIEWNEPVEVTGFGKVYASKCKKYFIDKKLGNPGFHLCAKSHKSGPYVKLRDAKHAADHLDRNGFIVAVT